MTITIIKPRSRSFLPNFKEIWQYRELILALATRDLKARYRQTWLGGAWAIAQPLLTMVVFSFFFGKLARIPSDNIPYPVFSYAGLLLWSLFSNTLNLSSNSLLTNVGLIGKVYFPRLVIPFAVSLVTLVDYAIATIVLVGLIAVYRIPFQLSIIWLPFLVILTWLLALSGGCILAAINVRFRDVRYIVPFFTQLLMYVTPVIYPFSVTGNYKNIVMLNPLAGFVETHRSLFLGNPPIPWNLLGYSVLTTVIILIIGLTYFVKSERQFADIL